MSIPSLGGWLVHVMRQADGALSLEEALHVIMDSMKEYFPCQSVAVILIDDETKELRIKISREISYTYAKAFRQTSPTPTAERVVLQQQPLLLNNLSPDSPLYRELKLEHDFTSAVLAPVVRNQRGIGYIFSDRAANGAFDDADLLHLQVIGFLIGALIEKFELIRASKRLSSTDDATGAMQYRAFIPAMATELERARTHHYELAFALFSVDAFRGYVEIHGINEAHALLASVVSVAQKHIRGMDLLARFSADEFILCLSGVTATEARAKMEAIQADIAAQIAGRAESSTTVTVGILPLETGEDLKHNVQDILSLLGKSLVHAKTAGAGRISVGTTTA